MHVDKLEKLEIRSFLGCDYEYNWNYWGNDISLTSNVRSASACYNICRSAYAFSWHTPNHHYQPRGCWCKDANYRQHEKSENNVISGEKCDISSF